MAIPTTRADLMGEIAACKNLLAESDYNMLKIVEKLTEATSATGLISLLKSFATDFKSVVENRAAWRETINACEAKLAEMGEEAPEEAPPVVELAPEADSTSDAETDADAGEEATQQGE